MRGAIASHLRFASVFGPLCLASCQTSEKPPSAFARPDPDATYVSVESAEVAAAKDAPEPEIRPNTYYRAGRLHESTGRFDLAIQQYRNAIQTDPSYAAAYDRLGIVLGFLGRHDESRHVFDRAIQLDPNNAVYRNNYAFDFILQKRWADAETELRRAILMEPGFGRARVNLGIALGGQGRFDDALEQFRQVLPEPDAQYNLGLAFRTRREFARARAAFERALQINPRFDAARQQLAHLPEPESQAAKEDMFDAFAEQRRRAKASVENSDITEATETIVLDTLTAEPVPSQEKAGETRGDFDDDGDVDLSDFALLQACITESGESIKPGCSPGDLDADGDVDLADFREYQKLLENR